MRNYLNITYNQILQDLKARLAADDRFKNIGSSTIYGMFTEYIAAVVDMTNFYMQRTAEEGFISTARLDSSIIKHCKNLGYSPRRPIPARCELIIRIKGPLPAALTAGTEVFFNRDTTKLTFNGYPYILDSGYSYVFTEEDIANGASADWYKDLVFAVPANTAEYLPLAGLSLYSTANTVPIKCFQAEYKTVEFLGTANMQKIGEPCQFYDVDDIEFADWYGMRDPFAFSNGVYDKDIGWCKVGIGADEDDAFHPENTYAIETQSIYLNEQIANLAGVLPPEPLKVCLIDTNPDKTVRVTFSSEVNIADIGLKSYKDNLYVKYLSTKGKDCNAVGVNGAVMSHNNQINACVNGSIVSLTNNIQFIINSDIYGGEYFESQASMKMNAPSYFSSRGKLVTKEDFMSYFRSLTSPMTVQTAMVFGQQDIEDTIGVKHPLIQNNIFYCLMGHLYLKGPNGHWDIRNVLTGTDSETTDTFSIYGDKYLDHICDYIKMLYSYESYYNSQYADEASEQWQKNVNLINRNCIHRTPINSVLMSLPPFVQYFDVVGTVYVKPLTDLESYTNEMKDKIYQYLDEQVPKRKSIYKSDIIKLYNEHPQTDSVDIDFKISNIIKADDTKFYMSANMSQFDVCQDTSLASYIDAVADLDLDEGETLESKYGQGWWNAIKLPRIDQNNKILSPKMFEGRSVQVKIKFWDAPFVYPRQDTSDLTLFTQTYQFMCDVSSDDNYITLLPYSIQPEGSTSTAGYYRYMNTRGDYIPPADYFITAGGAYEIEITLPENADYYSTSDISEYKTDEYGLTTRQIHEVHEMLRRWLSGLHGITEADRAINLPYTVVSDDTITRNESILRKGYIIQDDSITLSENSFWNYFVPKVLDVYGIRQTVTDTAGPTDINGTTWKCATNLIMDIYARVKPGICDSILDNNNNIVNFSTEMERACLQNLVEVKYTAR